MTHSLSGVATFLVDLEMFRVGACNRHGPRRRARPVTRQRAAPHDGVAELWWDSIDDLVGAAVSEERQIAQQLPLEDERRFIDVANSPVWLGEEIAVIGAP
jgi:hypothetical protein